MVLFTLLTAARSVSAQVTASQAPTPPPAAPASEICPLQLDIDLTKAGPREVLLDISAMLSSGWMRQDVNLTVSLLVNGRLAFACG